MTGELIIGYTGTRRGMSPRQKGNVFSILNRLKPAKLRHGVCRGGDEQAHEIAQIMGIPIGLHPPINPALRCKMDEAFMVGVVEVFPEEDYLPRDRTIVRESGLIIGAPLSNGQSQTGGTWYTLNYAKKRKKDYIILYTNGDMVLSRKDLLDA